MSENKRNIVKACRYWCLSSVLALAAIGLTFIWVKTPDNETLKTMIIMFLISSSPPRCLGFCCWFKAMKEQ